MLSKQDDSALCQMRLIARALFTEIIKKGIDSPNPRRKNCASTLKR